MREALEGLTRSPAWFSEIVKKIPSDKLPEKREKNIKSQAHGNDF